MQKSVQLVEEQFDQKVSMALCRAVDKISETEEKPNLKQSCGIPGEMGQQCCVNNLSLFMSNSNVKQVVDEALAYYDINIPFEMEVSEYNDFLFPQEKANPSYSCSLDPLIDNESHQLDVSFPGKRAYVFDQMWVMFISGPGRAAANRPRPSVSPETRSGRPGLPRSSRPGRRPRGSP